MQAILKQLAEGHRLAQDDAAKLAAALLSGDVAPVQAGAALALLRMRGETVDEICGFARAIRACAAPFPIDDDSLVDTCGTGGDGAGTFNISTVAAFVAAGAGCRVAKHGNRAVSSACGSADVLEALGVNANMSAEQAATALRTHGIAFLFAPRFHELLRGMAQIRRELGFRTVFNIVGPMANPAGARRQVIGVFDAALVRPVAEVLRTLGAVHALVVHGADGLDEITTAAQTHVCEVLRGDIREYDLIPAQFDIPRCRAVEIAGADAATNAQIALRILKGEPGPHRDIVVLNAGAAIYVAGRTDSIRSGVAEAIRSIDKGQALERLEGLRRHAREAPV